MIPRVLHVIDSSQPVVPSNLVNGAWNAPYRAGAPVVDRRVVEVSRFRGVGLSYSFDIIDES